MASTRTFLLAINVILLSTFSIALDGGNCGWYAGSRFLDQKVEKTTNLHFFFHDTISGDNPTAIAIAGPQNGFGMTWMADDPLTEGPEITSKLIGRAQGVYGLASQTDAGLLMVLNYVFLDGQFNGSTLSVLGRNPILNNVREMPIVGGTGLFRFARGYARAHTHSYTDKGDAIVEYNVTVIH